MTTNQTRARSRPAVSAVGTGFNEEARQAVNGAFEALSDWREELSDSAERHGGAVFGQMAEAAKAMGWPGEFVEAARVQMESASKLQLQIIDQVMDVWEQQLKTPGAAFQVPSAMMENIQQFSQPQGFGQFPGMPDFGALGMNPLQIWMQVAGMGKMPGLPDMGSMTTNPMQFWMQTAEMWQKNWASAFSSWTEMQRGLASKGNGVTRR